MQINIHRFKKPIVFLCGLCLSLSVFYNRGLITYALPTFDSIHVNLLQDGMLNLSGSLDTSWTRSKTSDYIDISKYNSVSINPFNISGVSNTNTTSGFYESFRLYICYYDENKNFISNAYSDTGSITWTGSSPDYIFYSPQSGNINIPNGAKYVRFSVRNTTQNSTSKDIFYAYPIEFNLTCNYDDGSFNVGVYGNSGVCFPLNVSGAYNPNYEEGATGWLFGSQILLSGSANSTAYSNLTLDGFGKAYYDIDLYITIDIDPSIRELKDFNTGTSKYSNNLDTPYVECGFPSISVTSIPDGLNYNIVQNNVNGTAIKYSVKNAWTNGMSYEWETYKNDIDASTILHIYGTTYISNEISIPLLFSSNVTCRNFPERAYSSTSDLLRFGLDYTVNGIVQKSSHTFGSEVEGLETIDESINNQTNEMIKEHEEEIQKGQETSNEITSSLDNVTSTLTAIEILKLPWTMLKDLYNAIIKDGQTSLTFPSFDLMGYTLWDAYEFDLDTLDTNFTVLFKSLRLISGIIICSAFGIYIRNYFVRLFGGDVEVE